jgi:hypothetical protein
MTDTRTMTQELQSEILSTVRKNQTAVVDAVETWAGTIRSITPQLPEVKLPYADKLPKPHEVVTNAYDFAEQLLAAQRQFADDLLAATTTQVTSKTGPAKKETHTATTK